MPKTRSPIFSFNGGEISRRMEGRSDIDGIWDRAVAKMLNFVATVEGPATKRPGFKFIKEAALSSSWLSRFVFNSTQAYLLEWLEGKLRFFTNGGRIELGGVPYELPVPYTAAEAPRISTSQSFDRLYLAHPNHAPGMLSRNTAETFSYDTVPLKNGPFKDWNSDKSKKVSWAGSGDVDGIATLTADFPPLSSRPRRRAVHYPGRKLRRRQGMGSERKDAGQRSRLGRDRRPALQVR